MRKQPNSSLTQLLSPPEYKDFGLLYLADYFKDARVVA